MKTSSPLLQKRLARMIVQTISLYGKFHDTNGFCKNLVSFTDYSPKTANLNYLDWIQIRYL